MASVSPPTPHLPLSSSSQMAPDEERRRRRRRAHNPQPQPNLLLKIKSRHRNAEQRMSIPQFSSSEEDEARHKMSRRKSGRNSISMSMSRKSISPPGMSITNMTWGRGTRASTDMPLIRDATDPTSYHLKWDDHLASTLSEIQLLLANELFVDVTLVCEASEEATMDNSKVHHHRVRAHKAILSNCSRYFERMFSENPCKHPVIVLKDFQRWEVEALLDFMYRGQIMVRPDRVDTLLKAADALQIRGLRECIESSVEWTHWKLKSYPSREKQGEHSKTREFNHIHSQPHHPHNDSLDVEGLSGPSSPKLLNLSMSGSSGSPEPRSASRHRPNNSSTTITTTTMARPEPQTAPSAREPTTTGHSAYNNHLHQHQPHPDSSPPFPRRKQARPRRRSGDFVAQDLRIAVTPPPGPRVKAEELEPNDNNNEILDFTMSQGHKSHLEGIPNLNHFLPNHFMKNWPLRGMESPMLQRSSPMKADLDSEDGAMSPVDPYRSPPGTPDSPNILRGPKHFRGDGSDNYPLFGDHHGLSFKASPPSPSFFMNMNNGHPLMGGPLSDSESNNPETPPAVFSPAGFPLLPLSGGNCGSGNMGGQNQGQGGQGQPWPGLPMGPAPIFGRHRAQHSAPRGGPPRAWSNADLTEALHNVWNKKMTTSQASRIFGIPYNSLLMYVRGKYGKSLKLDLLKKGLDQAMEKSDKDAAAAAAKKANNNNNPRNSPSNTPTPSSTPTLNNNSLNQNQNSISQKSKSVSGGSPPLGNLLGSGPLQQQQERRREAPPPQAQDNRLPPGFNPFASVSSIFGDYSPPFPFPSAAAAVALSHILPHHHHHPHHHLLGEKVGPLNSRRQDIEK